MSPTEGGEHAAVDHEHPAGAMKTEGPAPEDLDALAELMASEDGLHGWIHASIPDRQVWVFTYRQKGNFFSYVDISLVPGDEASAEVLAGLERHDEVMLKGEFITRKPQPHVRVRGLEVVKTFEGREGVPAYERTFVVPDGLDEKGKLYAKVHAVGEGGQILVVEIEDAVIPVFVTDPTKTEGLYRGDKVELAYVVAKRPGAPAHLTLDDAAPKPIEVVDPMLDGHGEPVERTGILVRYPKSPQIVFDIYAVKVVDERGVSRDWTLVNFEDQEAFTAIREKLGAVWKAHEASAVAGRNKFENPRLKVVAKGIKNVMAKNQANPQVLLEGPDSVVVEVMAE